MHLRRGPFDIESVPVADLSPPQHNEIWTLAERFTDTTRDAFEASVAEKKIFVLIRRRTDGVLVGMGGIDFYQVEFRGERRQVLYSGNLLFEEGVRGFSLVQEIGFLYYLRLKARHPVTKTYLFYDTFSYKSYLMLPRNFAEFWPRYDRETPEDVLAFLDVLGSSRYGQRWDRQRGLCVSGGRRLREGVATIHESMLADPHIRYFQSRNPGYDRGDMLAVIIPLDVANWLSVARNAWRRRGRRGAGRPSVDPNGVPS
jgi:hypothetical protein